MTVGGEEGLKEGDWGWVETWVRESFGSSCGTIGCERGEGEGEDGGCARGQRCGRGLGGLGLMGVAMSRRWVGLRQITRGLAAGGEEFGEGGSGEVSDGSM